MHRAKLFGPVVKRISIASFDALMADVMRRAPLPHGPARVLGRRQKKSRRRRRARWPNLILVHLPIHVSWLNQIEIFFSIPQGKPVTPADLATPAGGAAAHPRLQALLSTTGPPV